MANYKYKIQGTDYVFTSEEHEIIQARLATGKDAFLTFRSGKIGVNTQNVAAFAETGEQTDEQIKEKYETLSLPDQDILDVRAKVYPLFIKGKAELYKKMGWTQ